MFVLPAVRHIATLIRFKEKCLFGVDLRRSVPLQGRLLIVFQQSLKRRLQPKLQLWQCLLRISKLLLPFQERAPEHHVL